MLHSFPIFLWYWGASLTTSPSCNVVRMSLQICVSHVLGYVLRVTHACLVPRGDWWAKILKTRRRRCKQQDTLLSSPLTEKKTDFPETPHAGLPADPGQSFKKVILCCFILFSLGFLSDPWIYAGAFQWEVQWTMNICTYISILWYINM